MVTQTTAQTTSANLRRHDATELTPINLASSGFSSRFWARLQNGKKWRRRQRDTLRDAFDSDDLVNAVCQSWCLSTKLLTTWRILLFEYFAVTLAFLALRGSYKRLEISMFIYAFQAAGALFGVCSSALFVSSARKNKRDKGGHLTPPRDPREKGIECFVGSKLNHLRKLVLAPVRRFLNNGVFRLTAILMQNMCALVLFWDIATWRRLGNRQFMGPSTSATEDYMLHVLNLLPALFEIIFTNTAFRPLNFIPGLAFIMALLLHRDILIGGQVVNSERSFARLSDKTYSAQNMHSANSRILLFTLYLASCIIVYALSRVRQRIILFPRLWGQQFIRTVSMVFTFAQESLSRRLVQLVLWVREPEEARHAFLRLSGAHYRNHVTERQTALQFPVRSTL